MKKSYLNHKTITSKIPFSKNIKGKESLELSKPLYKKNKLKIKNDSIKDTVDGSCIESQTGGQHGQFEESLKSSKFTNKNNYSLGKLNNNSKIFAYSLKNTINPGIKSSNYSKEYLLKLQKDNSEEIISSSDDEIISVRKKSSCDEDDDDTNRIDYRNYPKIPEIEGNIDKNKAMYWLATYDKLMKKSKIIKILSYYNDSLSKKDSEIFVIEDANSNYNEEENKEINKQLNEKFNFKETSLIIQGYEIYFVKKHSKPFVRQKRGSKIFVKLYLLNLEQINQIFSYINRLEYKKYINNLNSFHEKNGFRIINHFNKSIYNYSKIFCLGTFMNSNIYMFSHTLKKNDKDPALINNLPSSNKIAKLIKVLMINFPEFTKQYFIDYLIKPKLNSLGLNNHDIEILKHKKKEVNSLLMSNNKNDLIIKKNNNKTNNIIKKAIRAIPTHTISSIKTQKDLNNINYINNDINCSDFLSNIKSELKAIENLSKKNNKSIDLNENKILNSKKDKIKSYKTILTRNNPFYFKINGEEPYLKTNFPTEMNKKNNICRTISLNNSNNIKSLTRTNSNMILSFHKINNKGIAKKNNNIIKFGKIHIDSNKENDANLLNKNLIDTYNLETNNLVCNNKSIEFNNFKKKDVSTNNILLNNNNNNIFSPYYTNINNNEANFNYQDNRNNYTKKPIKVLSTVKNVINDKINRLALNTNSSLKLNKINSHNSFKENNGYERNNSSYFSKFEKIYKINTKSNNSLNKINDYITPLKKKYFKIYS